MEVILRGVRGGIATHTPFTSFYGGNTACVEIRTESGELIFLDAGTGLHEAGNNLPDKGEAHVFITHGHTDHIAGLWFFKPLHLPGWTTHLYFPEWLENLPDYFYQCGFFPIPFDLLKGNVIRHTIKAGESLSLGSAESQVFIKTCATHHPGGNLAYRICADNAILLYTGDHEILDNDEAKTTAINLLRGATMAIVDAQYCSADHQPGFGHSSWEHWLDIAARAGVQRLALSHHDPMRSDMELDALDKLLAGKSNDNLQAFVAREGAHCSLGISRLTRRRSDQLFSFLEELSGYRSESILLDRILHKAREITHAEAGTIFLVDGDDLVFSYVHNDRLFSEDESYRHSYSAMRLPISGSAITGFATSTDRGNRTYRQPLGNSIAGFVASTGIILNLPDVHDIPENAFYRFNDEFDRKTGYDTRSMLTVPFLAGKKTLGVMQLINSKDPFDHAPCPFSIGMENDIRMLAWAVASALERSAVEKNGIYNVIRMASVHDPHETGPHAERVGAIASEIYHVWAKRRNMTLDSILYKKDRIRIAAMLHDIGKVGISDLILKKKAPLTEEERIVMRDHTRKGAFVLSEDASDIAALAYDIALHHHQQWDGNGYADSSSEGVLSGDNIPLPARITAIADVFDALVSPRCYKKKWSFSKAFDFLREQSGKHFDPDLVGCMMEIRDLVEMIYQRFPNEADGVDEIDDADEADKADEKPPAPEEAAKP